MEWKKVFLQAAITLIIGIGGVLIAFGVFQNRVAVSEQAIDRIANMELPAVEQRLKECETTQAMLVEGKASNEAAHAAILRELDAIQRQLQQIQTTIHNNPR